jgi:uncharacterized protein (DUF433 family)/DNA-binding transcriptional MerR regulator
MRATVSPLGSYTAAEVARLAGVSPRKIGSWARYGIIPSVSERPRRYSYADAGEAILVHYLVTKGKKTGDIRKIVEYLRREFGQWPLATAPLAHDGRLVLVRDRDGNWISVDKPEHHVIEATLLNLKDIRTALGRGGWVAIEHPREHIEVDPNRHSGAPVVRGRRVPTALVANLAQTAEGRDSLKTGYRLSKAQVEDAVGYETELDQLAA